MARPRNQLGYIRSVLYRLKRDYGATADVYYEPADAVDLATGARSVSKERWRITRAICLPTATSAQMLSPLAEERIWKQGAGAEVGDKTVIIDRRDFPGGFRLETHNYSLVIDRRRYEVLKVVEFEFEAAYLVTIKELAGVTPYEYVTASVTSRVAGSGGVSIGP